MTQKKTTKKNIKKKFKSGFVAIIGRPNVGKSTLLNALINAKIAITSPKPQTTRRRILGIKNTESSQIIFVDTPGVAKSKDLLGKEMLHQVFSSVKDADLVLFMVDCRFPPKQEDRNLTEKIPKHIPVILLLNKIDLIKDKRALLPIISMYEDLMPFKETFPISAASGDNLLALTDSIDAFLPEGPKYFGPEDLTEQNLEFRTAEIIREKVLKFVHQEVPHAVAVIIDEMRPGRSQGSQYIHATIFVEKDSQKGILVGKDGQMLKKIGQASRKDLENMCGEKVFLDLWVKVKEDWRDRKELLRMLGYSSE